MGKSDKSQHIFTLETIAKEILDLKQSLGLRRPLVIEFCGTPKAGKTTTISALNIFLKRNDFKTSLIGEMAGVCPIPSKTDFFFNSWTLFNSLAEMLKQLALGENKTDIILIDRALFDAMCWFKWLSCNNSKHPYISASQYKIFANFLMETNMWTKYIDLVYIFKASPTEALKREFSELLTTKNGTIMNPKVLESYNESIDEIKTEFGNKFRSVEEYDTTNQHPNLVSYDVTNKILHVLRELLTEKIGYFLETFSIALKSGINDFDIIKNRVLFFGERNIIEAEKYIQPVAIAVITDTGRKNVLVLKKNDTKTTKDSPEHNRMLLYLGGHLRQEDKHYVVDDNLTIIKRALEREIKEELNEKFTIGPQQPFLIYSPVSNKSKRHLAICFVIEMDLENKKFSPTRDEFIHKSPSSRSGTIVKTKDLQEMINEFEPWSLSILSYVFNLNVTLFG
jgi:predicted NUDIX family phosphoesterase